MAAFTTPTLQDVEQMLQRFGLPKPDGFQPIAGGSVNSNFTLMSGGKRWFLRIYEEQGMDGAEGQHVLVRSLAAAGVPTPEPVGQVATLAGKPAALFPWVEGTMRCQAAVTPDDTRALGRALATMHGARTSAPEGRFDSAALQRRLETIPETYPRARLARALGDLDRERATDLPLGLVHGDLFRDNVLWNGPELAAVLDFESAFHGPLVYDVAVCILSWCYGSAFDPALSGALLEGYESIRPLEERERRALPTELRFGAVRFTITRITDYAMRPAEGRVMKDWRRFLVRLDALEATQR